MLYADGFDEAILGIGTQFNMSCVVYDQQKCLEILSRDMPIDEAIEYFLFNVVGSYVGEDTPIFLHTMSKEEIDEFIEEE